jgi:hypothetical protein
MPWVVYIVHDIIVPEPQNLITPLIPNTSFFPHRTLSVPNVATEGRAIQLNDRFLTGCTQHSVPLGEVYNIVANGVLLAPPAP